MRRFVVLVVIALAAAGFASAGEMQKGQKETAFRLSFADTDLGSAGGFDLGSTQTTELAFSFGWLLTDRHEVGAKLGYSNDDIDGGDLGPSIEVDGTLFGGFYNYNFKTAGSVIPFVGASVAKLGGDLGDAFDLQYGAEAGVKIYPFEHAGFSFSVAYIKQQADSSLIDDADTVSAGAGLLFRY